MLTEKTRSFPHLCLIAMLTFFLFAMCLVPAYSQEIQSDMFKQLNYRYIGPQGNRVIAVVGVPGSSNICYAGAASGGIFKSTDGGVHWEAIFDDQAVSSIGSLAIAPSDPNIIWAGTGETFIRSNVSQGMGIYKSTDAGKTWKCMGLEKTGRIGRVIIDPRNPNIVFAAAMGHCYGPQQERGVFRTKDGGKSWEKVLFVDEDTGCSDLAMDSNNSRILFAGMWPMLIRTWGRWSGGPGGGLYVSRDGGTTWDRLKGHGLPETEMGKIAVAVAPSNSNCVYALIETEDEGLWRSDDGGRNWKLINRDHALLNRPHYYTRCAVATDDHNEIYTIAGSVNVSLNGGETFKRFRVIGGDNHDMWIDPKIPDRMMIGNDYPGIIISVNHGQTWAGPGLPNAQMYHVAVDNQIPYYVYGNRQDGASCRGPSNSMTRYGIPVGMWFTVGGCECGFAVPDPVDNNIVWSGCHQGSLDRFDLRTGHSQSVNVWPQVVDGWADADNKYRFNWTFPIAISPHDHNKVYVGSQYLHQTTDGGTSWSIISPDLSTNDKGKLQLWGGISSDDTPPYKGCTIFAIAESPLEEGLIWAGTNDGLVQVTRDGGKNWTNVTPNIPDLPPWGTVSNIEPSRFTAGACYITVDLHQVNNRDPYVYKTSNYGNNWKSISSNIPKSELSYAHCVREDPARKGLLYLGIENGLYVSFNDGDNWILFQNNLPQAPVHWLTIQEHFNDLVVATYGRGFWILDDITPLQQITPEIFNSAVHLFSPRPAYRFLSKPMPWSPASEGDSAPAAGKNPPYGADINYFLKNEPKEDIKIVILDSEGQTVRALKGTKKPGINRIWWDLRYEPPKQARLRTSPLGHPFVTPGPEGWRPLGGGRRRGGPLTAPGVYEVKITVEGKEFSQKLTVKKDPSSAGSTEDIQKQVKILLEIQDSIITCEDMVNRIELVRKQISDLTELLKGDENAEPILSAGKGLEEKLIALEKNFFALELTGSGDSLRWPRMLLYQLSCLSSFISKSDFPPTTQQIEVHDLFSKQVAFYKNQLNVLFSEDLMSFNNLLKEKNIPNIIIRTP